MIYWYKKLLSVILVLSCIFPCVSCNTAQSNGQEGSSEQSTPEVTPQASETPKADKEEPYVLRLEDVNFIFLSDNGELRLEYDPKLEPPYNKYSEKITHVETVMVRLKKKQVMRILDRDEIRKGNTSSGWASKGIESDSGFDYIYIIFQKGYERTEKELELINKFGIVCEFEQ